MMNQVFRDPATRHCDSFRVLFNDRVCSPDFKSKGGAAAYLQLLEKGRKPEYAISGLTKRKARRIKTTGGHE